MRNAYYEVARTYWRRTISSWVIVVVAVPLALVLLQSIASGSLDIGYQTTAVPWVLTVFGFMLWGHFRDQVTSEIRRLRPGFVAPHVVVFTGFILLIVVGYPVAKMLWGAPVSAGVMVQAAVIMAVIGWWVLTLWTPFFFISLAGFIWIQLENGRQHVAPLLSGNDEWLAIALLAGSLFAIAIAIRRILALTEEDPVYHRRLFFTDQNLRPRMTGDVNRTWAEMEKGAVFGLPKSRLILPPTGAGLWTRARRWRMLTRTSALGILFMAIVMAVSMRIGNLGRNTPNPMFLLFMISMPAAMSTTVWLQLWRFLEADSLRPIARQDFIREIGLAICLDTLRGWACFAGVIAADALLFRAQPFGVSQVVTCVWLSLLLQVPAFGLAVWHMRHRSPIQLVIWNIALMGLPAMMLLMYSLDDSPLADYRMLVGLVALALAIGGVFIIRGAYRRWLVTELG